MWFKKCFKNGKKTEALPKITEILTKIYAFIYILE